ncbi:MAG: uracil-DNA glycosylase, partial [Mucinivorans sp.]
KGSWREVLQNEFAKPYFADLSAFLEHQYATTTCYPSRENIFRAFDLCPFEQVRVVILGQDPYHEPSQACGLAFAVEPGVKVPPSLRNIVKKAGGDGNLHLWAAQGVLLLNAVLTVEQGRANSHQGHGWEPFTDAVIEVLNQRRQGVVYMLWGAYAQAKAKKVDRNNNLVLNSFHPSPLSVYRGFACSAGCDNHFERANEYLGENRITW